MDSRYVLKMEWAGLTGFNKQKNVLCLKGFTRLGEEREL